MHNFNVCQIKHVISNYAAWRALAKAAKIWHACSWDFTRVTVNLRYTNLSRWKVVCCGKLALHLTLDRWQQPSKGANHIITRQQRIDSKIYRIEIDTAMRAMPATDLLGWEWLTGIAPDNTTSSGSLQSVSCLKTWSEEVTSKGYRYCISLVTVCILPCLRLWDAMRGHGLKNNFAKVLSACNYYAGIATTSNAVSFRSLWISQHYNNRYDYTLHRRRDIAGIQFKFSP